MRFSKEERMKWLENWQKSGKGAFTYAKENGICPQTFVKWTKAKNRNESCFVEVPAQEIHAPGYDKFEIFIGKGEIKIHIPIVLSSGGLRVVLDTLRAAL